MSNIIHIDDSRVALNKVQTCFKHTGHKIHSASNWSECRALLQTITPELFIVDLIFPGFRGGSELALTLKKRYPDVPIVLYSGQSMRKLKKIAEETKVDNFVFKTTSMGRLIKTVCGYLPDPKEIAKEEAAARKAARDEKKNLSS